MEGHQLSSHQFCHAMYKMDLIRVLSYVMNASGPLIDWYHSSILIGQKNKCLNIIINIFFNVNVNVFHTFDNSSRDQGSMTD